MNYLKIYRCVTCIQKRSSFISVNNISKRNFVWQQYIFYNFFQCFLFKVIHIILSINNQSFLKSSIYKHIYSNRCKLLSYFSHNEEINLQAPKSDITRAITATKNLRNDVQKVQVWDSPTSFIEMFFLPVSHPRARRATSSQGSSASTVGVVLIIRRRQVNALAKQSSRVTTFFYAARAARSSSNRSWCKNGPNNRRAAHAVSERKKNNVSPFHLFTGCCSHNRRQFHLLIFMSFVWDYDRVFAIFFSFLVN